MNQLENGYSVSDTEDEKGGLISGIGEGDILSLKSNNSLISTLKQIIFGQHTNLSKNNM